MSCTSVTAGPNCWRRQPPQVWLFTDERLGGALPSDALWRAAAALPPGGGIVFRHYRWPVAARRALFAKLRRFARARRLCLVASHLDVPADGIHWRSGEWRRRRNAAQLVTAAAHDVTQVRRALTLGADLIFLSPVFATRSHPGGKTLGAMRFAAIARLAPGPVLALGGMTPARARRLQQLGAAGFAGIDCWAGAGPRHGGERNGALALRRHPL